MGVDKKALAVCHPEAQEQYMRLRLVLNFEKLNNKYEEEEDSSRVNTSKQVI